MVPFVLLTILIIVFAYFKDQIEENSRRVEISFAFVLIAFSLLSLYRLYSYEYYLTMIPFQLYTLYIYLIIVYLLFDIKKLEKIMVFLAFPAMIALFEYRMASSNLTGLVSFMKVEIVISILFPLYLIIFKKVKVSYKAFGFAFLVSAILLSLQYYAEYAISTSNQNYTNADYLYNYFIHRQTGSSIVRTTRYVLPLLVTMIYTSLVLKLLYDYVFIRKNGGRIRIISYFTAMNILVYISAFFTVYARHNTIPYNMYYDIIALVSPLILFIAVYLSVSKNVKRDIEVYINIGLACVMTIAFVPGFDYSIIGLIVIGLPLLIYYFIESQVLLELNTMKFKIGILSSVSILNILVLSLWIISSYNFDAVLYGLFVIITGLISYSLLYDVKKMNGVLFFLSSFGFVYFVTYFNVRLRVDSDLLRILFFVSIPALQALFVLMLPLLLIFKDNIELKIKDFLISVAIIIPSLFLVFLILQDGDRVSTFRYSFFFNISFYEFNLMSFMLVNLLAIGVVTFTYYCIYKYRNSYDKIKETWLLVYSMFITLFYIVYKVNIIGMIKGMEYKYNAPMFPLLLFLWSLSAIGIILVIRHFLEYGKSKYVLVSLVINTLFIAIVIVELYQFFFSMIIFD